MAVVRTICRAPVLRGGGRYLLSRSTRRNTASAVPAEREYPVSQYPISESPRSSDIVPKRLQAIKNAKPFSSFLTDTFQRQHDYLRISLTEKCNLRCLYCMPEEGVPQSPPRELLTTPEIYLLSSVFVSQGVSKIRLTGGEPTVRRDILPLMHQIGSLRSQGLKELCLTTNGISLFRKLDSMVEAGLTGVNLSLDTLDPWQFQIMTRRKGFEAVMKSMERILEMNKLGANIKLKINCVVMRGMNEQEILPFVELGREQDLEVRFIEYMPFDGNKWSQGKMLSYQEMLDIIRAKYPELRKVQDHKNDTSKTYEVPGFVGRMGFITSMTHNFCGTCNRLRITSDGNLKVCLFGNAEVSLRDILRKSNNGDPIDEGALEAMKQIEMDRRQDLNSSKLPVGSAHERELLDVIGMAVSRKKAKHAGIGELENMKNRPMILIDMVDEYPHGRPKASIYPVSKLTTSPWRRIPTHLLPATPRSIYAIRHYSTSKAASEVMASDLPSKAQPSTPTLTHLTTTGTAHMVAISSKSITSRTAVAMCSIHFSNATALPLIRSNQLKKGDVLGVARVAGIMAAKKTSDLIPLCHPIAITHVSVELDVVASSPEGDEKGGRAEEGTSRERQSVQWQGTGQGDAYPFHTPASLSPGNSTELTAAKSETRFGRIQITATVSCDGKTGVEMEALTAASTAALTVYDMCKAVDKGMRIEGLRVVRKEGGKSGLWVEGVKDDNHR
ncbi:Molybdenum cofactor biosynthesis C [Hyphodiscus hymeniophilus]|uniref:Molybdenum cofactor biosynthesis C n=1 Tax=Hyphodiscus hymeniophilus TaxID=353542 RepID=A0A9P6VF09_9HELO|nr:Molybdenum cofactor biosynthesis C [Hyphodiscus hymeniophilus]